MLHWFWSMAVRFRGYFYKRVTTVNADIYHGDIFAGRDNMILEDAVSVADAVAITWCLKRDRISMYAYSLEVTKQIDRMVEQGHFLYTFKGRRVVKNFKGHIVKSYKGRKLRLWDCQSIIRSLKDTLPL